MGQFTGLPSFVKPLLEQMHDLPFLSDFLPVEMCNLEYAIDRGACIEPHKVVFGLDDVRAFFLLPILAVHIFLCILAPRSH